ncbi:MAG: hypothetical protein RMI01_09915, partial [Thermodesulfovibrio sp.]|nr:hypothetical protein [Thermodesulfovibrio sp.]
MRLLNVEEIAQFQKYKVGGILKNDKGYDPKTKLPVVGGLFCYEIFGRTTKERSTTFGIIVLPTQFFHPLFYLLLKQKMRKYITHILSNKPYVIDLSLPKKRVVLFETEEEAIKNYGRGNIISYGLEDFVKNIHKILEGEEELVNILEYHSENLVIDKLPVIPPIYRNDNPMGWSTDKLNDCYGKLIRYSTYFATQDKNKNVEVYYRSYNVLQEEIGNLGEMLLDKLKGKEGAIRGNMLGRKVDYSGRAVIVPDPTIKVDEVGVPIRILVKIFEPFILRRLTKEENYTIDNAIRKLEYIYYSDTKEIYENEEYKKIIDIIVDETKGKIVLTKRDPAINRLSYSGFKVVPVFDSSIHLHPLNTVPFNADFDGDTMAVFAVMTKEAQEEAKRMLNPYDSQSTVRPKFVFNKDFSRAFRVITLQTDYEEENDVVLDLWEKTTLFGYKVTKGIKEIWSCLPQERQKDKKLFEEIVMKELQKKPFLDGNSFIYNLVERAPVEEVITFLNCVTNLLSEKMFYFTEAISIIELHLGEEYNKELKKRLEVLKKKYKNDLSSDEYIKEANSIREELAKEIIEKLKK